MTKIQNTITKTLKWKHLIQNIKILNIISMMLKYNWILVFFINVKSGNVVTCFILFIYLFFSFLFIRHIIWPKQWFWYFFVWHFSICIIVPLWFMLFYINDWLPNLYISCWIYLFTFIWQGFIHFFFSNCQ